MTVCRFIHICTEDPVSFLFMAELCPIVYMCHIFTHSSVDRHLDCFHSLAVVNSAVVNVEVHVSLNYAFFLGIYPVVGLLGHRAVLFVVF